MSLPSSKANLVGTHVYPIADLGLATTVTSAAAVGSTVFSTGYGATVVVLSTLSAGAGTLKVKVADTAANVTYGSPTATLACSGTSLQAVTVDTASGTYDTTGQVLSAGTLFVGIQQSAAASATWAQLAALVLYELTAGEEWFEVKTAINAVGNDTVGDMNGNLTLTIA